MANGSPHVQTDTLSNGRKRLTTLFAPSRKRSEGALEYIPRSWKDLLPWFCLLFAIMTVRWILEGFLGVYHCLQPLWSLFVSNAFFLSVFLWILLLLKAISGWQITRLVKYEVLAFIVILLPPVVDWFSTDGRGYFMAYPIEPPGKLLASFFRFVGGLNGVGVGIRMEIVIAVLGAGCLSFFWARVSWWKAVLAAFGVYVIIFVHGVYPGIIAHISKSQTTMTYPMARMPIIIPPMETRNALWIAIAICLLGLQANPKAILSLLKRIRISRCAFYTSMTIFGMLLAYRVAPQLTSNVRGLSGDRYGLTSPPIDEIPVRVTLLVFSAVSIYYFAQVLNDRFDIQADRVNRQRNCFLVEGASRSAIWRSAWAALFLGATAALSMGTAPFSIFFGCVCIALLYSTPPIRLKRIPIIASLVIGLACWLLTLYGFTFVPNYHLLRVFPRRLFWLIFLALPLGLQVKDLKDYEGDKADGTVTLATMLGPVWSKWVIATASFAALMIVGLVIGESRSIAICAALGIVSIWSIWRMSPAASAKICVINTVIAMTPLLTDGNFSG